jgi:hypothetical protein
MNARYVDEKAPVRANYPNSRCSMWPSSRTNICRMRRFPTFAASPQPCRRLGLFVACRRPRIQRLRLAHSIAQAGAVHVRGSVRIDHHALGVFARHRRYRLAATAVSAAPGNFDSFPTLGVVEASLQGAAMVCYDVLGMNHYYRGGIEIVVPPPDVNQLTSAIVRLKNDPKRLVSISKAGQRRSRKLFATSIHWGLARIYPSALPDSVRTTDRRVMAAR